MSKPKYHLITLASWEDRFSEGTKRICDEHSIASIRLFHVDQYSQWSYEHRSTVKNFAANREIPVNEIELPFSLPSKVWLNAVVPTLESLPHEDEVLVDVSTMPREIIWQVFWMLGRATRTINYVYHRPIGYSQWLSRDPGKPRLAYKMSGLSKLNCRTALVVLAGYDVDRVKHLVQTFEPAVTLLGLQKDSVDPQNPHKMKEQREAFEKHQGVKLFEVDAYSSDHGVMAIQAALSPFVDTHNVLMTSMGPKLSAIAMFKMNWEDESLGLVYLPANEFNPEYSHGIGESVYGRFSPRIKGVS